MNIAAFFDKVSSAMTVISFLTFVGILWWTFIRHKDHDFAVAAQLPFADDDVVAAAIPASDTQQEQRHV
jgi:cytochrome c oxidase cbb3-type subunit 4